MNNKKLIDLISPEEAVKSFVFPVELSEKERKAAAEDLRKAREISLSKMSASVKLRACLLQLKFQIEDYLDPKQNFDPNKRFGIFLNRYLQIFEKKNLTFAEEIGIHETLLSQFINHRRLPGDNIFIRLELHSNNSIPAEYWYGIVEKERIHSLKTNKRLRSKEKVHVSRKIPVKI